MKSAAERLREVLAKPRRRDSIMVRTSQELETIETVTLGHYDQSADSFWEGTKDHDVAQNYKEFFAPFPQGKTLDILDFGCGPGRDVKYFHSLGHRPVGLDGGLRRGFRQRLSFSRSQPGTATGSW
jgi:hypothetical protein